MSIFIFNYSTLAMEEDSTEILFQSGIPRSLAVCMANGKEENVELAGSEVKQLIRLARESRTGDNVHGLGVEVNNLEDYSVIPDDVRLIAQWVRRPDAGNSFLPGMWHIENTVDDHPFTIELDPEW